MAAAKLTCRIAMDGRMLAPAGTTGVGTYARALRRALGGITTTPLILGDRSSLEEPAPGSRPGRWLRALWPGARTLARSSGGNGLVFAPDIFRLAQVYFDVHRRLLPLRVAGPPGIIHWTYPVPLRVEGWANLYTVHDLIPLLRPDLTPIDSRRHRRLLDRIMEGAAALVTVSDAMANDIARLLEWPIARLYNCGCAVEPESCAAPLPGGLVAQRYLLAVGSVERRKNLDRLAQAHHESGVPLPLVIAGPDGWKAPALEVPGVIRLPYLEDAALRALIGNARALLMPSLAEGFGLPVVEAMALGTPVMVSAGGALEEIAGGAALRVNPVDVGDMAVAIRRLSDDEALCSTLTAAGRRNARRFSSERFAARLAALYAAQRPLADF